MDLSRHCRAWKQPRGSCTHRVRPIFILQIESKLDEDRAQTDDDRKHQLSLESSSFTDWNDIEFISSGKKASDAY